MMNKLFIVDDDKLICNLLQTVAESIFENIVIYQDARIFLQQALNDNDVVMLDLMMPDMDGIEVIRHLAKNQSKAALILISGYDASVLHSAEALAQDQGLLVVGNFTKPISTNDLRNLLLNLNISSKEQLEPKTITESKCLSEAINFAPSEEKLRNAIKQGHLILHYQPQVDIKNKTLLGVEALVRWAHPKYGLIYPDKFISLAEQSGLIEQLTEEVINLAVSQSQHWQKQAMNIKISVNISAQNITSLLLPEQIGKLIQQYQLDPAMFVFEVTESALMGNITTSLDILTRLRLKGFQLSIDDFGTGFSSLSQLHKIPFTELKIDQSFVFNLVNDAESRAIVETCVMLGHKLNMEVVAEGVENKEIFECLVNMGCDIAQGYYIAKPMPADELNAWLVKFNNSA
jgi:EAL domain-containing protein (putative c-di-GMP-specific phosphodiesterase class I)/ActR/RegA family two-component response regulator